MGRMYFSLKNNENVKDNIENIKKLIKGTTATMEVEDYNSFSTITIENMGIAASHIMSLINRNYVTGELCLRIYNNDNRKKEVKILLKDIDVIYSLS